MDHNHSTLSTLFLPYMVLSMTVLYNLLTTCCHLSQTSSLVASVLFGLCLLLSPSPSTQLYHMESNQQRLYGGVIHATKQAMARETCLLHENRPGVV